VELIVQTTFPGASMIWGLIDKGLEFAGREAELRRGGVNPIQGAFDGLKPDEQNELVEFMTQLTQPELRGTLTRLKSLRTMGASEETGRTLLKGQLKQQEALRLLCRESSEMRVGISAVKQRLESQESRLGQIEQVVKDLAGAIHQAMPGRELEESREGLEVYSEWMSMRTESTEALIEGKGERLGVLAGQMRRFGNLKGGGKISAHQFGDLLSASEHILKHPQKERVSEVMGHLVASLSTGFKTSSKLAGYEKKPPKPQSRPQPKPTSVTPPPLVTPPPRGGGTQAVRGAEQSSVRSASATESLEGTQYRPKMIPIEAGSFLMGTKEGGFDDERPQHKVTISRFFMAETQVTQAQYKELMKENPSSAKGDGLERPVESVTWFDAVAYCNALSDKEEGIERAYQIKGTKVTLLSGKNGYRLPTEAEWEFACRAGGTGDYGIGREGIEVTTENLKEFAWYNKTAEGKTHPVAGLEPNQWGLYDMHGNVLEWCEDLFADYSSGEQKGPPNAGSGSERVRRGGSCYNSADNLRAANRFYYSPDYFNNNLGFRPARTLP